jgi:hypothetical protein
MNPSSVVQSNIHVLECAATLHVLTMMLHDLVSFLPLQNKQEAVAEGRAHTSEPSPEVTMGGENLGLLRVCLWWIVRQDRGQGLVCIDVCDAPTGLRRPKIHVYRFIAGSHYLKQIQRLRKSHQIAVYHCYE